MATADPQALEQIVQSKNGGNIEVVEVMVESSKKFQLTPNKYEKVLDVLDAMLTCMKEKAKRKTEDRKAEARPVKQGGASSSASGSRPRARSHFGCGALKASANELLEDLRDAGEQAAAGAQAD